MQSRRLGFRNYSFAVWFISCCTHWFSICILLHQFVYLMWPDGFVSPTHSAVPMWVPPLSYKASLQCNTPSLVRSHCKSHALKRRFSTAHSFCRRPSLLSCSIADSTGGGWNRTVILQCLPRLVQITKKQKKVGKGTSVMSSNIEWSGVTSKTFLAENIESLSCLTVSRLASHGKTCVFCHMRLISVTT